jgi:succinoglycan biosynthesis protein ExoM
VGTRIVTAEHNLVGIPRIAICILTFRRPVSLEKLLRGVSEQRFETNAEPNVKVVVIDNDPDGSAQLVCARFTPHARWPLHYVHEPRRGIPQARNRALDSARDVDFIVFIDDDEIPTPLWLDTLLAVQREFGADAVLGPVIPAFEDSVPDWLRGAFAREHHHTGERLPTANAGNILIRRTAIEGTEHRFDERMALTGGEDTHFFQRMTKLGRSIVWADDAIVHEPVPPTRARVGWVLRRAYRTGITRSMIEVDLEPRPSTVARRVGICLYGLSGGLANLALGLLRGRSTALKGAKMLSWGTGGLVGLVGVRYAEYRQTHGS